MKNNIDVLKGKWLIKYSPDSYTQKNILEKVFDIAHWLSENNISFKYKFVVFDKNIKENRIFTTQTGPIHKEPAINFILNDTKLAGINNSTKKNYQKFAIDHSVSLENIMLITPFLSADKRWQSINLTSSAIFLGSSLTDLGFRVNVNKMKLPILNTDNFEKEITGYDSLGFTLFEDLFVEIKDLLVKLKKFYQGMICAGGPLVTLNPLATIYHLDYLNLLVRGEAEFVFPGLLKALKENNLQDLIKYQGFVYKKSGTMIISDFNEINIPADFKDFHINLDFLSEHSLKNGLEINVSRGCRQGCIFCCHVQGRKLRKLSENIFEDTLIEFSNKIKKSKIISLYGLTININDDDILQDVAYAQRIFQLIKKHNFKLWGIQTSLNSFFDKTQKIKDDIFDIIEDRELFFENIPLLWLGSDAFLKARGKRLAKMIPEKMELELLIEEFEKRDIRNYHYWISSDYLSDWPEFCEEFLYIFKLYKKYKNFNLLAHAPFLIPYSTTPLFIMLADNQYLSNQIDYKKSYHSYQNIFDFHLVSRVLSRSEGLNRLLKNEKYNNMGFFDHLKNNDYLNALLTIYNFLRSERISLESVNQNQRAKDLKKMEMKIERFVCQLQ